ncbi:MAG: DNA polymerase III subunit delta [Desulfococcaceae bacterium]
MPEIPYSALAETLPKGKPADFPPVCLIHGEEMLVKTAYAAVVEYLLPNPADRDLTLSPVDGDQIQAAIEQAATFSLFSSAKIVALRDTRVFLSGKNAGTLLEKARQTAEGGELKKAARPFADYLGLKGLRLEDIAGEDRFDRLKLDPAAGEWLDPLLTWCRENGVVPSDAKDAASDLEQAVKRGFPPGNRILITAETVDRSRSLYKAIRDRGLVVDASAPKGGRKADRDARDQLLRELAREILDEAGKRIDPPALAAAMELTGFDPRTFSGNLEKLVQFVGDRDRIAREDVDAVLRKTRRDPIYQLTNAVTDRDAAASLRLLDGLLRDGLVPLQILAALVNQFRKLVLVRAFADGPEGRTAWRKGMPYPAFQRQTLPALKAGEERLSETLSQWDAALADPESGRRRKAPASDLLLAKSSRNPYPLYQLFRKADRFRPAELADAMGRLAEADHLLKSSGKNPRLVLERAILAICRPAEKAPALRRRA